MESIAERRVFDRELARKRSQWLKALKLDGKEDKLFEMEVFLKGLDRFFNLENLPLNSEDNPIRINFIDELAIAGQGFSRITELSRKLLEASERSYYQFRYYIETELLGDLARGRIIEQSLSQRSPEDSLMLIYTYFLGLKNLCQELTKLKLVRYPLFFHLGSLTSRAIVQNRFFNPVSGIEFRPEYDRVENLIVKRAISSLNDSRLRHFISVIILAFYRLLRYLSSIDERSVEMDKLKQGLIVFALINSESRQLIRHLEMELKPGLEKSANRLAHNFAELADGLAFQLSMELKKINQAELAGATKQSLLDPLKASVENSKGILSNFLQQSIVQMIQLLEPEIKGEAIFPDFIPKKEQSRKLRMDLAVFRLLMDRFEELTETSMEGASLSNFIQYLKLQKRFIQYLEKNTASFFRYGDLVEFRRYFAKIKNIHPQSLHQMERLEEFKMESKFFKIFLETTLSQINQRADLRDEPLDDKQVEAKFHLFLSKESEAKE